MPAAQGKCRVLTR